MNRNNQTHMPTAGWDKVRQAGFTLLELMIVVAIIAILAAIAYPSYTSYIVKTHRAVAAACLSEYANYMERYYTTNLRYDQDSAGNALTNANLPMLGCASNGQTRENYTYQFPATFPTATTYKIEAVPQGAQATRDTECGTLTLDQTGQRTEGGTSTVEECW